ncbi:sugar ABC transporter permease [Paenibacillus sp. IB182496]|uniref:Sugar ABC transporter permease n=1 Tax=Paenibacillus sabuli TaxID=2772509 RepID=A0A927GSC6_9BACL|nr:ABC transporter permease subunit [Paenibacillus sabuli]MBD2846599.1 sugar ABC transporter permease [Paenibacillus sabuli]
MDTASRTGPKDKKQTKSLGFRIWQSRELYLFLLPAVALVIVFNYFPMYGITVAFKDFKPHLGIMGSPWAGLKYFDRFFDMPMFSVILKNTLLLSFYTLIASFPLPIILALALNSTPSQRLKKIVQTITYAPHFISIVIIVGMLNIFFSPSMGIVRNILSGLGLMDGNLDVLMNASSFPHLYVWSGVWQTLGWSSIIYLGALSAVDPALHESAVIDGASKFQRVFRIDLPLILPTIVILLILESGTIMNIGFEKVFLMQNAFNLSTSEVINTYVYKVGIREAQYSLSSAIGLFNSGINFILILLVNQVSRRLGQESLW